MTEILTGTEVISVEVEYPVKTVVLSNGQRLGCHALIVASGMTIRRLGVDAVEDFVGAGVYYGAAPSEAVTYRGEDVFVVGGAFAGLEKIIQNRSSKSGIGFVADVKSQAIDHGFHVHDERHFVETYSMRQSFEVDLHPEEACGGPLEFHLSVDVDPRAMLAFEDALLPLAEGEEPAAAPEASDAPAEGEAATEADIRGFAGDRDQRRLGHRGAETEGKCKQQQP